MAQQKQGGQISYSPQTPQPPIFGQSQQGQQVDQQQQDLMRLLSILRARQQGGLGNIMGGKGGGPVA